jgi:DNA processing protein
VSRFDLIAPTDPSFPLRLREVRDAPRHLYIEGTLPTQRPVVALVGARSASGRGLAVARELAAEISAAGALVVSGGAIGIDSAAHRGALDAGRPTCAVLACGLDIGYPQRNRPLFDRMVAAGGAVLSSYEPGVPVRRFHFIRRNRILAGMADAVVVIEAQLASGSLYTAMAARDYRRTLGAVPGSPGCEALIAQGAAVIERAADLVTALEGRPRRPSVTLPALGSQEAAVLGALDAALPRAASLLADSTGLPARDVARMLTGLELEGLAVLLPGQAYVRSIVASELVASSAASQTG